MINTSWYKLSWIEELRKIVKDFIDDYYAGIRSTKEIESLDSYCDLFRKQMATWAIAPVLMSKKVTTDEKLSDAILAAYGSFGIAWRLVDDLNDIESDMLECIHSSIYVCLPKEIKVLWDKHTEEKIEKKTEYIRIILNYLVENSVIKTIMERLMSELESATSIAHHCGMIGLADDFRCLLKPLRKWQNHL
jgi:hypothetical protein